MEVKEDIGHISVVSDGMITEKQTTTTKSTSQERVKRKRRNAIKPNSVEALMVQEVGIQHVLQFINIAEETVTTTSKRSKLEERIACGSQCTDHGHESFTIPGDENHDRKE